MVTWVGYKDMYWYIPDTRAMCIAEISKYCLLLSSCTRYTEHTNAGKLQQWYATAVSSA